MFKRRKKAQKEFIPTNQEIRETSKVSMKDLLGGKVLSKNTVLRQIPFILFVTALILFYIANQYKGEKIMRQIMGLEKEVKELRSEYSSTAFDRQQLSTQSEIIEMINAKGLPLLEAKKPPYIIKLQE
ncbi:MAG: FtsL-like putative cell division protein [Bacteroidota bacterium]